MGGDFGISVTVPAAVAISHKFPTVHLLLVGDSVAIEHALKSHTYDSARISIQHASQQVAMDESPAHALRSKKDSSMRVAINLVKENRASACVSAGNTGALMATAHFVLKTIPGVDRPAIISRFPTVTGQKSVRLLDLGANVDSSAQNLLQFAVMGSLLTSAVDNISNPKVYLLNIGEEDIKGNEQVKKTAELLSNANVVNYMGYIEGDAIFDGVADVIVCDGFVGNVALKTIEGAVGFITQLMKGAFMRNWYTKIIGLIVKPVLKPALQRVDPGRYNGAALLGLQGVVIKSHGGAKIPAFENAIKEAIEESEKNIPDLIRHGVGQLLNVPSP
jgi:glycerol-3-phosphate acyltransferase PlsX